MHKSGTILSGTIVPKNETKVSGKIVPENGTNVSIRDFLRFSIYDLWLSIGVCLFDFVC